MEEMIDVYNRDGKHLGIKSKSFCNNSNFEHYTKPVWVWIINDNGQILVQKRTTKKKNYPGKWDMSCAGHVTAGETSIQGAIREVYEELGIQTTEIDYKFICEYLYEPTHELGQVYLLKLNARLDEFNLQETEVSEIKWITLDELKKLIYSEKFAKFDDDYRTLVLKMLKDNL